MGVPGSRFLMEEVSLPDTLVSEILAHCRSVYPEEGCGIVASDSSGAPREVLPITNSLHSPVRYQMEIREQFDVMKRLRKENLGLWAIFHSHPLSEPFPSPTDVRLAFYPDCLYIIAGLSSNPPSLRCFSIVDGQIEEKRLRVTFP